MKEGKESGISSASGVVSTKPELSEDGQVPLQVVSFLSGEVCG